jgi:hypothetical protein
MSDKILILLNCFFNTAYIERTLISIINTNYNCDIIFLENPSKYSNDIKILAHKYNIYKHFICNENIEGNVFQIFVNKYKNIIDNYNYIAMSEADVELEKDSIKEAIEILNKSGDNVDVVSIDLLLNNEKYYNLPINQWVPSPIKVGEYTVGPTGFQFIIFKKYFLYEFINSLNKKEICNGVALGVSNYMHISDSNLASFISKRNHLWVRTITNKLDHIGWEFYISNKGEYVEEKKKNLSEKKIRANLNLDLFNLVELK